ncbi:MAG TPA: hypothetical protein PLF23_15465 [Candidatus Obscuribacter sp.]|nr:hypothetical protein [Candidatus Obscuribacter sp.]
MSKVLVSPIVGRNTVTSPQVCQAAPRASAEESECSGACRVNTAGTVRVNNMANLESYITSIEWGLAAGFLVVGVSLMVKAARLRSFSKMTAFHKCLMGLVCIYLSTRMPGIITFLLMGDTSNIDLFS